MQALRSIAFNFAFFVGSAVFVSLFWLCLPSRDLMRRGVRFWGALVIGSLEKLVGISREVRGWENLPPGPVVIASKHQSAWETMIFLLLLDRPVYVLKKELRKIPLWGWYSDRYGNIAVDREAGASALKKMVADTLAALKEGRSVVIFPEGTRTPPDERKPYHPGVAAVYARAGVPVVPVALNSGLFWGRRHFIKRPGRIVLEFLPPMPAGLDRRGFMAELEGRIETATDRLVAEARGKSGPAA
jgi:1-acyl-sn-glycerol-3-phosphate acyltransferase